MTELLIEYVQIGAELGRTWGPLIVFVLMAIESSFIPFPSEVVMIPAGFMAARGEFLPPDPALGLLDRSEELFRRHGEITTFVCRLIPAVRQLISIPAGLSRMRFGRFALFTGLGAGIWVIILALTGFGLGKGTREMSYAELVHSGEALIGGNLPWIFAGLALIVAVYVWVHRRVMHGGSH
jgi:membrane protein DedA with SNARE-associated domain